MRKSSKNRHFVIKKLKIRNKIKSKKNNKEFNKQLLSNINWKKLDNLYKQILQVGRTKKISFPKSRKTKKRRKK